MFKEQYTEYKDDIDFEYLKNNYKELSYIYSVLDSTHSEIPGDVTVADLSAFFWAKYPDADKDIYPGLFKTLQELEITPDIAKGTIQQIKRRKAHLKLSETAFKVAQGLAKEEELNLLIDSLEKVDHEEELPLNIIKLNLTELIDRAYQQQGFRWRLDCLNKSLGSLRRGDFGFIFARPETGKTTFLTSEATGFTDQGAKVCWFNNEEQGDKVGVRLLQAYHGVSLDELKRRKQELESKFHNDVGERITLLDSSVISKADVEKIIERYEPDIVIYDQIDKIRGFSNDREDLRLGAIYQWARELAKNRHAAIGVCQADGSAENVRYLTMEHVANAKTAKQAEADWIIGIGCTHDPGNEFTRYINISKNKLFGDSDSRPELRHGKFEVLIEPTIARYRDVLKFD